MTTSSSSDRDVGRRLMALHRLGRWPARLSMMLPVASGALLVPQTWLLASVLHRAVVENATVDELAGPVLVVLALVVVRAALGFATEALAASASERIKLELRTRLFADMLGKLPVWTAGQSSGALSALVVEQVDSLDGFFVRYLPAMVQAAILPVAFAALVFPLDWVVALIFVVTAPLIPVFMMLAGWGAQAATEAQAGALARLTGRFADRLRGIVTLKLFGRDEAETAAMFAASEELRRRSMGVMRIAFLSSAVLEFFAALGVAGVALYGGLSLLGLIHMRAAPLSLEAALFCLLMAPEVYQPLRLLAANYHDRAAAKAALGEIARTLGELPAANAAGVAPVLPRVSVLPPGAVAVSVRHLAVSTPDDAPVLANLDLDVPAGRHVAVLGPSGSGKSTLIEALARLRPHDGQIMLGDARLEEVGEMELRDRVVLIGQRSHLFAGTIADNIRQARPDACGTAIRTAARRAMVTDFADALPDGLETVVGENGLGLSGGEIQRVALARLYLCNPGLILLDEPTAHLDPATEARVLDNLLRFAEGRTLIAVTHSAAVAERMHRVYRLAAGQLLPTPISPEMPADLRRGAA